MRFICQKIQGEIRLDFVLATVQGVEFKNWYEDADNYSVEFIEDVNQADNIDTTCIPVGTVEFVEEFYKKFFNLENILPLNIPLELTDYTQRNIWYGDESDVQDLKEAVFCKSIDKVKGFTDIVNRNSEVSKGKYMFSELIDIESEWRCFVYRGRLLGIHNYVNSIDKQYYPDTDVINEMINKIDSKITPAYTLDVGVNEKGTFVIEVHDFYSCGLYGFRNFNSIIDMLIASHKYKLKKG